MGGSGSSSSHSQVVSAPYANKVTFTDPQVKNLLSNLSGSVNKRFSQEGTSVGDALNEASQKTLQSLQGNNYSYKENPYASNITQALAAQDYSNFQKNFAKEYSNVQGYGQGTASRRLADVYSDYANKAALQRAQTQLGQYNTDLDRVLKSTELGLGEDTVTQMSPLILALGNLFKETYGITPATTTTSHSNQFNIL